MKAYIKQGWRLAVKHFYIVILLFVYQLIWGFFLYRFVNSIVVPLLQRYPDTYPSEAAIRHFLAEAQFQLFKTDLIHPYLWLFGIALLVRMLLTPLFNAGLFHSLRHAADESGTQFISGIRKTWKPVMLLYWCGALLSIAPAWWLLPRGLEALLTSQSPGELAQRTLPYAAAWLLWILIVYLLFLAMQFGVVSGSGIAPALLRAVRHFLPFAGISLLMWGIGAAMNLLATSVSMIWAGLFALILHQGFYLVRTLVRVWTFGTQYVCWQSSRHISS